MEHKRIDVKNSITILAGRKIAQTLPLGIKRSHGFCRAAAMTLRTVLLSLQALLAAAEPDDPQDAVVAQQYKELPEVFAKTARHWANVYADGWPNFFSTIEKASILLSVVS